MGMFTLTIETGNDAMRTREDIAEALEAAAEAVRENYTPVIVDTNGNRVGQWVLTLEGDG